MNYEIIWVNRENRDFEKLFLAKSDISLYSTMCTGLKLLLRWLSEISRGIGYGRIHLAGQNVIIYAVQYFMMVRSDI